MSREKERILELLEKGKITSDEALKLLDAIGASGPKESKETIGNSISDIIKNSISFALKKTGEVIDVATNSGDKNMYKQDIDQPEDFQTMEINLSAGDITVVPSEGNTIEVFAKSNASLTEEEVENLLRLDREAGHLKVSSKKIKRNTSKSYGPVNININNSNSMDIIVKIPESLTLQKTTINTSYGDVEVRGNRIENLQINSSYGDIEVKGTTGIKLNINTSYGDITMGFVNFKTIYGNTSMGDADLINVKGEPEKISLSSSMGDILADLSATETNQEVFANYKPFVGSAKFTPRFRVFGDGKHGRKAHYNKRHEVTTDVICSTSMGDVTIK
ncbi:MAG: DUF4097 family beta strand repeat-containing protein [Tissierellia bacterium]|nr:DUF4097 family beta strand repeat-containing protein [Tissierellia bacterium]